jgi:hypothetical protein
MRRNATTFRATVLIGLAAAVLAALAVFLLKRPSAPERVEAEPAPSAPASTSAAAATAFPPASIDGRSEVPVGDLVEVCGLGRIPRPPGGEVYPPAVTAAANAAFEKAAAELAASSDPRQRAVGLYVRGATEDRRVAQSATARADTAELARVAVSSRDPAVYALAFYRCNKAGATTPADASCSLISAANWAQLEPDNAIAWLYVASAARGDERARDEAIFRASRAQASRLHWNAIGALNESRVMKQQPMETRGLLQSNAIGIYSAFAVPDFRPMLSYCSPARAGDATRRQVCGDLAAVLADHGTTLLELSIGTRLGVRMGWPADRVAALRNRTDAIQAQLSSEVLRNDPASCRSLAALERRSADLFAYGEVGGAERRIRASGRNVEQLAQQWREEQSALQKNATRPPVGVK